MLERLPQLSVQEAEEIERECREAQSFVYDQAVLVFRDELARDRAERLILERFAWINAVNLTHAISQGAYYEWHG